MGDGERGAWLALFFTLFAIGLAAVFAGPDNLIAAITWLKAKP